MQIASSRNPPKRLRSNFVLPEYAVGIPRLQAREDVNLRTGLMFATGACGGA